MSDYSGVDALDDQVSALELTMETTAGVAAAFEREMRSMQAAIGETSRGISGLEKGLTKGLRSAFDGVVFDGLKLSDALGAVAQSMIDATYAAAINPVAKHFGGMISSGVTNVVEGMLPFENGAPFSQGRVMPFARGGVVNGPVNFPMRGGMGLMGEAGPEAIMPLARGADGKLGVRGGSGGGNVSVTMNITTPDVSGFRRSQGQIAAQMTRALGRGQRNR